MRLGTLHLCAADVVAFPFGAVVRLVADTADPNRIVIADAVFPNPVGREDGEVNPGAAITEIFGEGLSETLVEQPSADVVSTSSTKAGSRVSQSQWLRGGCVLPALDSIIGKSPA